MILATRRALVITTAVLGLVTGLSRSTHAQVIVYTETGTLSGTLGGTAFTNAAVTITTTSTVNNIVFTSFSGGAIPAYTNTGTTTIQIAGFGLATFNGTDSIGALSGDLSALQPGLGIVGIYDYTLGNALLFNPYTIPALYDLSTPATYTGAGISNDITVSTTLGTLVLTSSSATGNATFTTSLAAVPETSPLLMSALAAPIGLAAVRFRRRRKA
ncbi:MAG: hypothetical protein U0835_21735 [Isosphaeraceae bacterium]